MFQRPINPTTRDVHSGLAGCCEVMRYTAECRWPEKNPGLAKTTNACMPLFASMAKWLVRILFNSRPIIA